MGVQPIEKPRVSHHEGQTALQDLRVFATTFNVGDRLPSNEDMQYWLPPDLLERHHILAFALQEAAVESGHDDEPEEEAAVAEEAASDAASSSRRDPRMTRWNIRFSSTSRAQQAPPSGSCRKR